MEVRRLVADLGGTGGEGEGDAQGCGQNCGHADMDGIFPGHRLILSGLWLPGFPATHYQQGQRVKVDGLARAPAENLGSIKAWRLA